MIARSVRQEIAPLLMANKGVNVAVSNCTTEVASMKDQVNSLHGTAKVLVGLCFLLWVATTIVIFISR